MAKEFNIPKNAELILDWDCGNVDDVVKKMFEPKTEFVYKAPKTSWDRLLVRKPSTYTYNEQKVRIKPLKPYYDLGLRQNVSSWTSAWEVDEKRAKELVDKKLVRVLE